MFIYNIISVLTLIGAVIGITVPEDLMCCSPGMGPFRYFGIDETGCWDDKLKKIHPPRLPCSGFNAFLAEDLNFTLTESGQVLYNEPELENPITVERGELCFANDTNPKTNATVSFVIMCEADESQEHVLGYCMIVTVVFLLITTLVYAALPEIRDLQGKSIVNFCGSMGIGLGILASSKLVSYHENMALCATRGFATYFFLVATFFWSNAISMQVLLSLRRPVVNNYSWKEFSWYALYAWGCPIVLTLCMAIVNFHPGDHHKPGIGLNTCWFHNTRQQWYYLYSVMAILIIINIGIFIYTSVHLWRLSFSSNQVKALRYKFVMTLRLFIIMGVAWIFEMISSVTGQSVIWFVIDVFNTLQGPLIFLLLVVFRKRVIKALLKRGCLSCMAGPVERYLAVKEDDEEGVIQHTLDVTMNDRNGMERNEI